MVPVLKNNIDDILQEIKRNYDYVSRLNKNLKAENKLLKTEQYKDKELQRLKAELERQRSLITFYISEKGKKKRNEFIDKHKCSGAINCHYEIYPTGIGEVIYYVCGCGERVMLEDI